MSSSVGMMKFPIYGNIKNVPTTNQNVMWAIDKVVCPGLCAMSSSFRITNMSTTTMRVRWCGGSLIMHFLGDKLLLQYCIDYIYIYVYIYYIYYIYILYCIDIVWHCLIDFGCSLMASMMDMPSLAIMPRDLVRADTFLGEPWLSGSCWLCIVLHNLRSGWILPPNWPSMTIRCHQMWLENLPGNDEKNGGFNGKINGYFGDFPLPQGNLTKSLIRWVVVECCWNILPRFFFAASKNPSTGELPLKMQKMYIYIYIHIYIYINVYIYIHIYICCA